VGISGGANACLLSGEVAPQLVFENLKIQQKNQHNLQLSLSRALNFKIVTTIIQYAQNTQIEQSYGKPRTQIEKLRVHNTLTFCTWMIY